MPELWHKLGLRGDPKRSCLSPFRDEKEPSFSVFQVGSQWFYKDHATGESGDEISLIVRHTGCEKKDAIQSYHDLAGVPMPEPKAKQASNNSLGKLVKIYDYRDANGNLVHQTLRFEPKRFLQRRPAAEGMRAGGKVARLDRRTGQWWIWTLEGIEPVLYRLPELAEAPLDKPVFICEGEKDADTIAELGGVATTAPMGAGKWRKSYTPAFKDKRVIICPDFDDAGLRHAQMVGECLRGIAKAVKILATAKFRFDMVSGLTDRKLDIAEIVPLLRERVGTA
jgi:DNA primase